MIPALTASISAGISRVGSIISRRGGVCVHSIVGPLSSPLIRASSSCQRVTGDSIPGMLTLPRR